jgi:ATP-dependent RNA helicase RhlE
VPEDYVHRIGRTGRAGATGEAISLVSREEQPLLRDIERVIRRQLPREVVPGFETGSAPSASFVDTPGPRDAHPAPRREHGSRGNSHAGEHKRAPAKPAQGKATQRRERGTAAPAPRPGAAPKPRSPAPPRSERQRGGDASGTLRSERPHAQHSDTSGSIRRNLPPGWK